MEADENGVTAKNTYGGPLLLRTVFGDIETTYQYMYNAHGDVVTLLTDGEVVATYYYDSFGNILEQTGEVSNSILYAGYQYDEETGLYYINARMYDPVTARFLQADTYLGNTSDPLSLNLYTYCFNNPHKYTDPSGHIPLLLIGAALLVGAVSAQAEYKRQVREGDNYTNLVSIGVVGISNTLLCLIPGGKAVSAYKMATAGGSFVLKTFAVQFGKAVGLGVAAGYATDAGIEVARQLATGTKLSNLEYDRINEAGVTGAIAGGAGAIFGAGVEALANTRVGQSVAAKFTQAVSKGRDAIKNGFAKVAGKNGKSSVREMTGLGESRFKLNLQFFASDDVYRSSKGTNKLLAGEGDIGTYDELIKSGKRGDGITPHHMPSDKYMASKGVSRKEGLCINMEMPVPGTGGRHRLTDTCGRNMTDAQKAYYYSLSPRDALAYDLKNVKEIYQGQGLYSEIKSQLRKYAKKYIEYMPELFSK